MGVSDVGGFLDIKTSMFFDQPRVMARVKDGTKSMLSKAGAFIRTVARRSIRPRKDSALPGQPPSSHTGLLRDRIFFGYDTSTESLVVGPTLSKGQRPTAPELLEFGGKIFRRGKMLFYRKFPFMAPALESEAPKFPGLLGGSVKE